MKKNNLLGNGGMCGEETTYVPGGLLGKGTKQNTSVSYAIYDLFQRNFCRNCWIISGPFYRREMHFVFSINGLGAVALVPGANLLNSSGRHVHKLFCVILGCKNGQRVI